MNPTNEQLAEAVGHLQAQLRELCGYAPPARADLIDWRPQPKTFITEPICTDKCDPPPAPTVQCDGAPLTLYATLTESLPLRKYAHRFEYLLPEAVPGTLMSISVKPSA